MLLIFCGSLLPDPDLPYSPSRSNLQTWVLSIAYEVAILIMCLISEMNSEGPSRQSALAVACEALSASRVVVLSIMAVMFLVSRRTGDSMGSDSERESLLSEEQSVQQYGSAEAGAADTTAKDAQTVSAFDYLAGFRDLVPYLW